MNPTHESSTEKIKHIFLLSVYIFIVVGEIHYQEGVIGFMVFNACFKKYNISVKSWRSVLLVEETGGPGKNH